MILKDLLEEIDRLPTAEKWQMVRHLLNSLEREQSAVPVSDWHELLRATYGILADDPVERPPQLPLEERESLD